MKSCMLKEVTQEEIVEEVLFTCPTYRTQQHEYDSLNPKYLDT